MNRSCWDQKALMYWFHPRHVEGWTDAHGSAQFELNYHWTDNLLNCEQTDEFGCKFCEIT